MRPLVPALFISALSLVGNNLVSAQVGTNQTLLDPNLAEVAELTSLPQLSSELANALVAARPILSANQLHSVLGAALSDEQRAAVYGRLFRQIDLNSASREEIMLIPGMSSRMAHEFEEYRPYTTLEQFRREIGKYVDAAELARLEQYVFIPLNLNTASAEDIATIPGMTPRMVHEFEEYRPYSSIEQFQREIGKYVDPSEVARLQSYLTLE